jgi:acyl carrier protein phosphodiesterase
MNYLAHAFLSGNDTDILVGNYIADHIKLAKAGHLPGSIRNGMMLHRKIDYFTDTHPLFLQSKRFFYEGFERYSGVLMDIYYDHLLATNFERFSEVVLQDFVRNTYTVLEANLQHLPISSQRFLSYAKKNNTFFEYSKLSGIELVLQHLSYRIDHGIDLSQSVPMFEKNKAEIEKGFFVFMKDLIAFVKKEMD